MGCACNLVLPENWHEQAVAELSNMKTQSEHGEADSLLCLVLIKLGYKDIVAAYDKIPKWYE